MDQSSKYLVIGGGAASAKAAVAIRKHDPSGSITLICGENHFPYDKPPLSKNFLTNDQMTAEDPESKDPSWYTENKVAILKSTLVDRIDRAAKTVHFGGLAHGYEKLLLTTGASPKRPDIPGVDGERVHFLRSVDDAEAIRNAIRQGGKAVMIGGGYIGLEVAASAMTRGVACTIIDPIERVWRFASPSASAFVRRRFEKEGATFVLGQQVASIESSGRGVTVGIGNGEAFDADFVVVGAGVTLNTRLAGEAGLDLDRQGAIKVDETLRTSDPNIWAAGDVASYHDRYSGESGHVEHYMNATWTGDAAGASMAGVQSAFDKVAYFFSDMLDIHMAMRGLPGGKLAKQFGSYDAGDFIELYSDAEGVLRCGLIVNREESKLDPISDQLEAHIQRRDYVDRVDIGERSSV